ncbi:MAG: TetR/AcrR family transcriptional regulator, partial [Longimicrobiales bacterium]
AGLALLEEEGPAGVTVQAVVKRARSSVGSFYARFRGKEDLLAHLAEHVRDAAVLEWRTSLGDPVWATGDLAQAAGAAVDHLRDVRARWDTGLKAAATLGGGDQDYETFRRRVVEELASRLLERYAEITHPSPDVAMRIGLWAVLGVIDHEGSGVTPTDLDADTLRSECVAMLLAYLTGRPRDDGGQVDFFDVWG